MIVQKSNSGEHTFPANTPKTEIDFIALYTGKGATANVASHTVVYAPVESDHSPIFAEISIEQ